MNLELFDSFMVKGSLPSQRPDEWRMFLEICEEHLKKHEIKNPIAVELGTFKGRQKIFYEQLLGAEHIGINVSDKHSVPDILGDTHDSNTLTALKKKLNGRPINILFIDADHAYEAVKMDFEMYSPLCTDIVAFHDIETGRYRNEAPGIWNYWDELKETRYTEAEEPIYENFLFISIHQCHFERKIAKRLGIGVIIKR